MEKVTNPWSIEINSLEKLLQSDIENGLNSEEIPERIKSTGENLIVQSKSLTFLDIFLEEIREPLILLLILVGVVYSIWGKLGDAITIFSIIIVLAFVEVFTEYRAKKSIESLKKLSLPTSWVLRDGRPLEIITKNIVPGDILILRSGEVVAADARIISGFGLEVNESQLTGEALPVSKAETAIFSDIPLAERTNMIYMGSTIVRGRGKAIVTATGMDTELGRIAGLSESAREPKTPLQKAMKELSVSLVWIAVFFSILIPVLGLLQGMPVKEMILTGFSLAFATIPEEMPIIITMVLGLSAMKLGRKNVLIRRLRAAETLGSITVIATDKTGTLTENKMKVTKLVTDDEALLLTVSALTADVVENKESSWGDPMDIAILEKADAAGITKSGLLKQYRLIEDCGFDPEKKIFRQIYKHGDTSLELIKGAPESMIDLSGRYEKIDSLNGLLAGGSRVTGVAYREFTDKTETKYTLLGFICFEDPVREGVREAIHTCMEAGVRIVMITGDHVKTAVKVAEEAGIAVRNPLTGNDVTQRSLQNLTHAVKESNIFARITPEQKLGIVQALRENGEVIAVTGDGINDAPALKSADIGVSMGKNGTDVAKEASDMILTDDSFISIVEGIKEGRKLFENLSKCVKYYLSCKIALVLSFLIPLFLNIPLPFAPVQIILLELFMDLAASTSFVNEPMEADVMKLKPRDPREKFMNRKMISGIFSGGITLSSAVLAVYLYSWFNSGDLGYSQTMAFGTWLLGHVVLALHMRTNRVPLLKVGFFTNRSFNLWMIGVVVFLTTAIKADFLQQYLKLTSVGFTNLLISFVAIVTLMSWIEMKKIIQSR
ncbi:MAG: cation-transporting P-type ATPase [Peptococcaceae bacterium]|nr:cation-transporting P-type ATPase [Peptococcaceae bacterium]